jgi:ligand-binding SRPBCC domain-containing protein
MRYTLYREQHLACPIDTAWGFFSSPQNLSKITPEDMAFTVQSPPENRSIYEGMRIRYTVSPLLGIPLQWETLINQVDPYRSFTDFQIKGPYSYWNHFHEFIPTASGVLVKDTVEYQLPCGVLGRAAHVLVVKQKLEHIFDFRRSELERRFN